MGDYRNWFLVAVFVVSLTGISSTQWYCKDNENCVTIKLRPRGSSEITENLFNDLAVCRLMCHKFASLWPVPKAIDYTKSLLKLSPAKIFVNLPRSMETRKMLEKFTEIFRSNAIGECGVDCDDTFGEIAMVVEVSVNSLDLSLWQGTNETYSIESKLVDGKLRVNLSGESIFGIRHGFETLNQLLVAYTESNRHGLVTLSQFSIKDEPFYPYRGLLLDTARNFISLPSIMRTIDGMAASKLNVFHWHITDSQSFPLEIPSLPIINKYGSYSEREVYTVSDVKKLREYARERGVRVVLEFDSPAHVGNGFQWGNEHGLGNLAVCVNQQPWRQSCIQPPCGQFNPINSNVYDVIKSIFEVIDECLDSQEMFHMGGDEVFIPCWNQTEEITKYMKDNGQGVQEVDFLNLWSKYHSSILSLWNEFGGRQKASVILWSSHLTEADVIERYLPKDRYIIQTWLPSDNNLPINLLNKGYRLVISTKNAWYFDHGFWGNTQYYNWRKVYDNQLPSHNLVLGGEACMWGEYIEDKAMDFKIWPRAAAVAERLWSNPRSNSMTAQPRFYRHSERLLSRGIGVDSVVPEFCRLNEGECF